jgi:hypothetical protein
MQEPMSLIVSGHVYAFDRASGKSQWAKPAYIDQQGFLAGQPNELPVFTFIRNVQSAPPNRNQPMHGSVLCLDKRTGRLVYSDDELPQINGFDISGNLDDKTVTLSFASLLNQPGTSPTPVTLKFTDEPVKSAAPYRADEVEKTKAPTDSKDDSPAEKSNG